MFKRLIDTLKRAYDYQDLKARFVEGMLVESLLIVSVPYFMLIGFYFPDNSILKIVSENYGIVTIFGLPFYFLIRAVIKDKVRSKSNTVYFTYSLVFVFSFMIKNIIENYYYGNDIPNQLTEYIHPIFNVDALSTLVLNFIVAPFIVMWSILTYYQMRSVWNAQQDTNFKSKNS